MNIRNWKGGEKYDSQGYVQVKRPNHPRAGSDGRVPRSILVWEEFYGMQFPEGKIPHHDSEIKDDDRPENIIPKTPAEHNRAHHLGRKFPNGYNKSKARRL